jgi:hypothetical protein
MESNGIRGRIHVSQQTADELIASGKQAWILRREDKIVAKGKGELQTYFVNPAARDGPFTSMGIMDEAGRKIFTKETIAS